MIISQNGAVDLIPEYNRALRPIFCVSEGDANSRTINLTVTSAGEVFNIPEGAEVYVAGKKQDNTIFTYQCAFSGYIVSFPIAEQMSAANGLVLCELQIVVAGDPLGSANFCYWVEPSPIANGSSSESDLNIFEQAIAALGGYEYLTSEVSVLSARMDQFARLPDGSLSTSADAELVDIRVMANGKTASTAGDAVREQITDVKSAMSQVINNLTYEIASAQSYRIEFALTAGKTYSITNKGSSGQFTMHTRETSTSENLESVGTFRAGETKQFTPSNNAGWLVGYANSATVIYIEEAGLIASDVEELNQTSDIYKRSFIANNSISLELGMITAGEPGVSDEYVRSADFAYAAKGDMLNISPDNFSALANIYLYSAPDTAAYDAAIAKGVIAIGETYTYTFERDCYFKLRAQKEGAPTLTNDDIANFESIISWLHHYSYRDFESAKITPSALPIDYDGIKSQMAGKVNFAIQTDTHISAFYRYKGTTRLNPSDFDEFESAIKAMKKLTVNGFANLGDIVAGYEFDPDYETRESLKKIIGEYEDFGPNERFFVIGNHDDGGLFYGNPTYNDNPQTTDVLFPAEQFNRITKHGNNNGYVQNYYYKDLNGIRIIVLYQRDFNYSQEVPRNEQFKIGATQIDWLINTALNTNLPVLVLTHAPLVSSIYDTSREGFDDVLTALNNFTSNGGTVIAVLSGHKHQEAETTFNGINHIVFTNGYAFFYLLSIDLTNRTITCTPINNPNLNVRAFIY